MGKYWTRKYDHEDEDERTVNPWAEAEVKGDRNVPDPEVVAEPLSEYEKYCQDQMDLFEDNLGDDRCFPEMAEGQFVRGH